MQTQCVVYVSRPLNISQSTFFCISRIIFSFSLPSAHFPSPLPLCLSALSLSLSLESIYVRLSSSLYSVSFILNFCRSYCFPALASSYRVGGYVQPIESFSPSCFFLTHKNRFTLYFSLPFQMILTHFMGIVRDKENKMPIECHSIW